MLRYGWHEGPKRELEEEVILVDVCRHNDTPSLAGVSTALTILTPNLLLTNL